LCAGGEPRKGLIHLRPAIQPLVSDPQRLAIAQRQRICRLQRLHLYWHGQWPGPHTRAEAAPMKNLLLSLVVAMLGPTLLFSDAGVLIPRDKQQPNPAILSLEEMEITIRIDNGDARVFVRQVFANHTGRIEEGNYI